MSRIILILPLVMAALVLSACGNRGDLYLPTPQKIVHHQALPVPTQELEHK